MSEQKDISISVRGLHKSFKLPHEQHSGLKQMLLNVFNRKKKKGYEVQHVLKGLDFDIEKGDFFGIVGRNGSGKSTLLKLLAGIYTPDKGAVNINGTLIPFIELGVGFNPELTGRENIFLNGALLGYSHKEMLKMFDDIVEFAELEEFMDQKLKNYSSGMQVRLAFSIAIRANADILLLDEVLAVGDEAFQRKCFTYFAELKKNKKTVILVTHNMDSVQQFCNKAMLVDKGHKLEVGNPMEIAKIYRELNSSNETNVAQEVKKQGSGYISASVEYENLGNELAFNITLEPGQDLDDPIIVFEIFRDSGEQIIRWVTDEKIEEEVELKKGKTAQLIITFQNIFPTGNFTTRLMVRKKDRTVDYGVFNDISKFTVSNVTKYRNNNLWKPREKHLIKYKNQQPK